MSDADDLIDQYLNEEDEENEEEDEDLTEEDESLPRPRLREPSPSPERGRARRDSPARGRRESPNRAAPRRESPDRPAARRESPLRPVVPPVAVPVAAPVLPRQASPGRAAARPASRQPSPGRAAPRRESPLRPVVQRQPSPGRASPGRRPASRQPSPGRASPGRRPASRQPSPGRGPASRQASPQRINVLDSLYDFSKDERYQDCISKIANKKLFKFNDLFQDIQSDLTKYLKDENIKKPAQIMKDIKQNTYDYGTTRMKLEQVMKLLKSNSGITENYFREINKKIQNFLLNKLIEEQFQVLNDLTNLSNKLRYKISNIPYSINDINQKIYTYINLFNGFFKSNYNENQLNSEFIKNSLDNNKDILINSYPNAVNYLKELYDNAYLYDQWILQKSEYYDLNEKSNLINLGMDESLKALSQLCKNLTP